MAEEENGSKQDEAQVIQFDPKDNRIVFSVVLLDMDDDIRDVVGVLHLAAADVKQAVQKAILAFQQQGLAKTNGRYHFIVNGLGPLPDANPQIIRPNVILPKDLTKHA